MDIVGFGTRIIVGEQTEIARGPGETLLWTRGPDSGTIEVASGQVRAGDTETVGCVAVPDPESTGTGWLVWDGGLTCELPAGVTVVTASGSGRRPVEFHAGDAGLVFLRGPLKGTLEVPPPDSLVVRGQDLVEMEMSLEQPFVEVAYRRGSEDWRQRHYYSVIAPETVVLVTAEFTQSRCDQFWPVSDRIAATLAAATPDALRPMAPEFVTATAVPRKRRFFSRG